jgi:hypothetical protein
VPWVVDGTPDVFSLTSHGFILSSIYYKGKNIINKQSLRTCIHGTYMLTCCDLVSETLECRRTAIEDQRVQISLCFHLSVKLLVCYDSSRYLHKE